MNNRIRQIAVLLFVILDIVLSFELGSSLEQSPTDAATSPVYFLPINLTFAIWGVIYTGTLIYAIYQLLPAQQDRPLHRKIGGWVALNAALTALWSFLAKQAGTPVFQPIYVVLTVVVLFGMLASLTRAFMTFRNEDELSIGRDRWLVQVPITIFFAWLNVAAIANTTAALVAVGFTGEPYGAYWAVAMLIVAALLVSLVILYSRVNAALFAYTGVVVWAVIGIFFNNVARSPQVSATCVLVALWVIAVTIYRVQHKTSSGTTQQQLSGA